MASGSLKSNIVTSAGSGYYRQLEVVWSSTNSNAASPNNSTVTWSVYSRCPDSTNTARYVNAWNIQLKINGVTVLSPSGSTTKLTKDKLIASGTTSAINHDSTGRKTGVAVALSANIWDSSVTNCTINGSINMDPNPVYGLSITKSPNSSSSTLTVNRTSCAGNGATGNISASTGLYYGDVLKITASPTSEYNLSSLTVNGSSFTSGSSHTVKGNVSINIIAVLKDQSSTVTATDAYIEEQSTITITKKDSGYYHTLYYKFLNGDSDSNAVKGYIKADGTTSSSAVRFQSTSVSFTVPSTFYNRLSSSATSGVCKITCTTYASASGAQVGSAKTCTFTASTKASRCRPTITNPEIVDSNQQTISITGNSSYLIIGRSVPMCQAVVSARNGATLGECTINGEEATIITTTMGKTFAANQYQSGTFTFKATDSRGYSTSVDGQATAVQYTPLTCVPTFTRGAIVSETTYTPVTLSLSGNFFNGKFGSSNSSANTLAIKYKYKKYGDANFTDWINIPSNSITIRGTGATTYTASGINVGYDSQAYNSTFDYRYDYEFVVVASDKLANLDPTTTITKTVYLYKTTPLFDWGKDDFAIHANLRQDGNIYFDGLNGQTDVRRLIFSNSTDNKDDVEAGTQTFYHYVDIYGGNPKSKTAIGIRDCYRGTETANIYVPFSYEDQTRQITLYGRDAANYLADFPNTVKTWTEAGTSSDPVYNITGFYRKYNTGIVEAWVKCTANVSTWSSLGDNTGYTYYTPEFTLPIPFHFYNCVITGNTNHSGYIANAYATTGNNIIFRIARGAVFTAQSYTVYLQMIGNITSTWDDREYQASTGNWSDF